MLEGTYGKVFALSQMVRQLNFLIEKVSRQSFQTNGGSSINRKPISYVVIRESAQRSPMRSVGYRHFACAGLFLVGWALVC